MEDDETILPDGMLGVDKAVAALHLISTMIGSHRHSGFGSILSSLRGLGFSDETAYYMMCYIVYVVYEEFDNSVNDSVDLLHGTGDFDIQDLLESEGFESLADAVRYMCFVDEDVTFGAMRPSWKEHFKSVYNDRIRGYLNSLPGSIPYYLKEQ